MVFGGPDLSPDPVQSATPAGLAVPGCFLFTPPSEPMPSNELERAREVFLNGLAHDGVGLLGQEPLVAYWQSVEAEARMSEDLSSLERWSRALARDKDEIEALKSQARSLEATGLGGEDVLALIRHILELLDASERKLNRRLAAVRDRLGRWVFLAGPGVKQKPPPKDEDKEDDPKKGKSKKDTKRALIQRPKPKDDPKKVKSL